MDERNKFRVLNRDVIKYIAMFTMMLNHIGNVLMKHGEPLTEFFCDIGYFTAITMCYFMVEGYQYTKSKKKYGIRLFIFAVISQFPYSFAFQHGGGLNMIYTLFLCFLVLVVREKVANNTTSTLLQVLLVVASCVGDWPLFAPVFVILFDEARLGRKKFWDAYIFGMVGFGIIQILNYSTVFPVAKSIFYAAGSVLGILASGLVIRYLYNGKRATYGRNISKWFFYIFYPAHLLVIGIIDRMQ